MAEGTLEAVRACQVVWQAFLLESEERSILG